MYGTSDKLGAYPDSEPGHAGRPGGHDLLAIRPRSGHRTARRQRPPVPAGRRRADLRPVWLAVDRRQSLRRSPADVARAEQVSCDGCRVLVIMCRIIRFFADWAAALCSRQAHPQACDRRATHDCRHCRRRSCIAAGDETCARLARVQSWRSAACATRFDQPYTSHPISLLPKEYLSCFAHRCSPAWRWRWRC